MDVKGVSIANTQNQLLPTYNQLDALLVLRGFACLMVVILHSSPPRNAIFLQNYDLSWLLLAML
jgi:hypothetical protein